MLMIGKNLWVTCCNMVLFLVIISLLLIPAFVSPVSASQSDAASAISSAQNSVLNCFEAARAAEAAGANITVLTGTLNDAGSLLSRAELAYSLNDFDAARDLAGQSQAKLVNFISEANSLGETAAQQRNQSFLIYVASPLVGAFVVIGVGVGVWVFLKKRYEKEARM